MLKRLRQCMTFQVISQARDEAAYIVANRLEKLGCRVCEIRVADIEAADGSKIDEVFVYVCRGTRLSYAKVRRYYTDEIMYEGRKTLM